MDTAELLGRVKSAAGLFEAYEVRTVTGYRNAKDGGVQEVTIRILDAGPDSGGIGIRSSQLTSKADQRPVTPWIR